MAIALNPYINFRDNTRDAMNFYHSVFGGDLRISTFEDYHAAQDPAEKDLVMHSMLTADNGVVLMAADVPARMEYRPGSNNFSVSLSGEADDEAELRTYFDKLSAGGMVLQPLTTATWGDAFGMLQDRFGITWLVNIAARRNTAGAAG